MVPVCAGHRMEESDMTAVPAAHPGATRRSRRPADASCSPVRIEKTRLVTVVRIIGEIDLEVAPDLQAALDEAIAAQPNVVVDLTHAYTVDSAGLGVLVRARNRARRRRGELVLAGPSRFVQTVLRTMRLDTAFPTFATVRQAITARGSGFEEIGVVGDGQWSGGQ
jgi:anti-sigma B factor antagonist